MRQIRCRNCGHVFELPDYHGPVKLACPVCRWEETRPARRKLPEKWSQEAGAAFALRRQRKGLGKKVLEHLHTLPGEHFLQFCASLFEQSGYSTAATVHADEVGHDLDLKRGDELTLAACRHYAAYHKVQRSEVETLAGSMRHEGASQGIFVTTGEFEESCADLAEQSAIDLINGGLLQTMIESLSMESLKQMLE